MNPTQRELDTILAALRFWQIRNLPRETAGRREEIEGIARYHGPSLDDEEVDQLCNKLAGEIQTSSKSARLAAVRTLAEPMPGVDWQMLDEQRLQLAEILRTKTIRRGDDETLEGVLGGLDWLTDLAHEAGLISRPGPKGGD